MGDFPEVLLVKLLYWLKILILQRLRHVLNFKHCDFNGATQSAYIKHVINLCCTVGIESPQLPWRQLRLPSTSHDETIGKMNMLGPIHHCPALYVVIDVHAEGCTKLPFWFSTTFHGCRWLYKAQDSSESGPLCEVKRIRAELTLTDQYLLVVKTLPYKHTGLLLDYIPEP